MNIHYVDLTIVLSLLVLTLIVGLWAGRGIDTVKKYVLGDGFSTYALAMTYLATAIGGAAVINNTGRIYFDGIVYAVSILSGTIQLLLIAWVLVPKIPRFDNCLTIGDIMKFFYGEYSGMITGFLTFIHAVCISSIEFFMLRTIVELLFGITSTWPVVISAILLTIYTSYGGIKAVTFTDVVQFIIVFIAIPLIAFLAYSKSGGLNALMTIPSIDKFSIIGHKKFPFYLTTFFTIVLLPLNIISPFVVQRMLMAKGKIQMQKMFLYTAIGGVAFLLLKMVIAFSAMVLYPNLEPGKVFSHSLHSLLPIGLKGVAMAGLLSVSISTLDSFVHIAGVTFVHDFLKPLCNLKNKNLNELTLIKWCTALIGCTAVIIFGLNIKSAIGHLLKVCAFTAPITLVPLVVAIFNLKPDKKAYYLALIATLCSFVITNLLLPNEYSHIAIIIHVIINAIVFFLVHFITYKGFAIVQRDKSKCEQKPLEFEVFNPFHLAAYARTKAEQFGIKYSAFGILFLIQFSLIFFIWYNVPQECFNSILWLKFTGGCMCVLLIAEEKWFGSLRKYLPLFWYITLGFVMPFTGMLMLLITNGDIQWLIQLGMGIGILFVFIDMAGFLGIFITSIVAALLVYVYCLKASIHVNIHIESISSVIWQIIFGACAFGYFLRNRQKEWEKFTIKQAVMGTSQRRNFLEAKQESHRMAKVLEIAGISELFGATLEMKETIKEATKILDKSSPVLSKLKKIDKKLTKIAVETYDIEQRAIEHMQLTVSPIHIADIINTIMYDLDSLNAKENVSFYNKSKKKTIECDFDKIRTVLTNSVIFARSFVQNEDLHIVFDDAILNYPINTVDNRNLNLDAIRITIVTPAEYPKKVGSNLTTYKSEMHLTHIEIPEKETDLPLLQNKRIIRAHYGFSISEVKQTECTQVYVIPCELRQVRPKEMDNERMILAKDLPAPKSSLESEKIEKDLLEAIKQKAPKVNMERVKHAIECIKKYHALTNRLSGEPYYLHPIAVAKIVMDYDCSEDIIIAALLHDTIEDSCLTSDGIEMLFNKKVAVIVTDLTNIECNRGSCYRLKLSSVDNILQLLAVRDKRSLYIKIADRLHNLRTISHKDIESQLRKAEESILFYVPLAEQLEMKSVAEDMRSICIKVLNDRNGN